MQQPTKPKTGGFLQILEIGSPLLMSTFIPHIGMKFSGQNILQMFIRSCENSSFLEKWEEISKDPEFDFHLEGCLQMRKDDPRIY